MNQHRLEWLAVAIGHVHFVGNLAKCVVSEKFLQRWLFTLGPRSENGFTNGDLATILERQFLVADLLREGMIMIECFRTAFKVTPGIVAFPEWLEVCP